MPTKTISGGVVHRMPDDLKAMLLSSSKILTIWEDITPLARNEWICWVEDAKKDETRKTRIKVAKSKLLSGMRRPCCWIGCIHRTDKAISPSVKYVLAKKLKTR
jgi:hypothetical protein